MRWLLLIPICLVATTAAAQPREFRGEFVGTYLAEKDFLEKLPPGTRLNCEGGLCSTAKTVRIYVFRNSDRIRKFWSTDYSDVMFDEPERLLSCGRSGHIVYYDETGQLLLRDQLCRREGVQPVAEGESPPVLSLRDEKFSYSFSTSWRKE